MEVNTAPGMGKSFALKCFTEKLNPNMFQTIYLSLSTVSVSEFYKQLALSLKINSRGGKAMIFDSVKDRLYQLYKEKKTPMIMIIDEAQYLSDSILKDLKMLMNFDCDSLNCFSIVLSGESYLNHTLEKPVHEALKQRITVHYGFKGLSDQEVKEYISHKLKTAKGNIDIVSNSAISMIHSLANSNPRQIDNIMTFALTVAAQMDKKIIDEEVILAASENISLF